MGMAEIIPKQGATCQGVCHSLKEDDFEGMDKLEAVPRTMIKVKLYDGTTVDATVYLRSPDSKRGPEIDKPPTERFIDILVEGARFHRLDKSHINYLRSLEQ